MSVGLCLSSPVGITGTTSESFTLVMADDAPLRHQDSETAKAPKDQRYRNVFYTYNNPTKEGPDWMEFVDERVPVAFHACELEQGDKEGTKHFQGYIEFRQQMRKSQLISLFGAHFWFRARRGTALQAYEYVTKTGAHAKDQHQRIAGPWEQGVRSKPGYRTDIEAAVHTFRTEGRRAAAQQHTQTMVQWGTGVERVAHDMFEPYRREVKLIIMYGQGGTGKTEWFDREFGIDQVHRMPTTSNLKWLGNYRNQPYLQIDEFKGIKHMPDPSYLHTILDKRTLEFEVKRGYAWGVWHTVIITTNKHPRQWFDWDRTDEWEPFCRRIDELWIWIKNGQLGHRDPDRKLLKGNEDYKEELSF